MKHLVVVSFDAMVTEDLDLLKDKPVFSRFLTEGSRVNRIRTIYPSLTYPAHTSMLTGTRCGRHGVVNNEPSEVGNLKCDWYWFHVAEYWAQGPSDTLEKAYRRAGTSDDVFENVVRPVEKIMSSWEPESSDEGKVAMACAMIRRYRPNLLTVHLGQIDSFRHRYGVFNDKVAAGVLRSDNYMKSIMDACKDAGIYEDTDFVICSDHGQINYTRKMNLNALFVKEGLIELDDKGAIRSWKAWAKSANFSAQIYLSDPSDKALYEKVRTVLEGAVSAGNMGIGRLLSASEAKEQYGLYGDFSFVIESDESTLFFSRWTEPLFSDAEPAAEGYQRASHGHDPAVGPQPVFIGLGPSFRSGVVLPNGSIIDEAPTYAKILGIDLPDAEGRPMNALLR